MGLRTRFKLAACTVGPDYARPESPRAAGGAFLGADNPAFAPAEPPEGWWRLYQDAELDRLVEEAFAHNTDLRVATANLERARALLRETRAGRLPQVGVSAGANYARVPETQVVELSDGAPQASQPKDRSRAKGKADSTARREGRGPGLAVDVLPAPPAVNSYARPTVKPVLEQTITDFLAGCRAQDRILLLFAGHRVEREYYYNDAGSQMERFRASVEAVRRGEPAPEDGYHGAYVAELAALPGDPVPHMLERIEASLERGVLEVRVPRADEDRPVRIPLKTKD